MTAQIARALAAIEIGARERAMLERFVELFLARNAGLNLSAARDPESVASHVADSLTVASLVRGPFVDVGSGGGFPAIPLAIATGFSATLVEATGKKAKFLAEAVRELGLPVVVRAERAEDAARDVTLRGAFASATARAVSNVSTVLELTIPFLAIDGIAVLQRGGLDDRERTAASDAALVLGAEILEDLAVSELAGTADDDRRVLIVRKNAATGPRFPRRAGIPAKRPLCFTVSDLA